VAPNNSNLPNVKKELDFLNQLDNLGSQISSVLTIDNGLTLKEYIQNNSFSILHFACHGMFDRNLPNDSAIQLTNDSLRPSDIKIKFKKVRPLIFINACHGGRVGFSFTNIGGWAKRFVNARVGIFIGAMWEVNDELAYQFAETFYTFLLRDNLSIAESFQKSRQAIRKLAPYNSTWLAYSLYADPEAKIKLTDSDNLPSLPTSESLNYRVCHNCQLPNPVDGKFCTQCGSKLIE
ncbi:MAG: CHAT domain-containing protein, partial [Cyanobacteria bacterium J06623_7]